MRTLAVLTTTLLVAPAGSEPPALAPAKKLSDARLQEVLAGWAEGNDAARQAHIRFKLIERDDMVGSTHVDEGEAQVRKPDLLRIHLKGDGGVRADRTLLCTGAEFRDFDDGRELVFHPRQVFDFVDFGIPKSRDKDRWLFFGSVGNLKVSLQYRTWPFMGFPVKELPKRFKVTLDKEDEHWSYLTLVPNLDTDRDAMKSMQVILHRQDSWVRRVSIYDRTSAGVVVIFDFENSPDTTTPVTLESVTKDLPVGFQRTELPDFDEKTAPGK
jgi:hypothetical protein